MEVILKFSIFCLFVIEKEEKPLFGFFYGLHLFVGYLR